MSYQVLEEDCSWEEGHDRLLINVPIVGCAFVKTMRDEAKGHNVSTLVLAKDLVLDYYAKSVESCSRKTHILRKWRNEVYEKVKRGVYRDVLDLPWYKEAAASSPASPQEDVRTGQTQPSTDPEAPLLFLEQSCFLDLDGDGYAEPYTVLVEEASRCVLRIVARWDRPEDVERLGNTIIHIRAVEAFTKYGLIPSPDGGIYDMGFGLLLGPLNESVNTLINQLVDTGTMQNTAGGFLGRGVKIRGGVYTFAPLEWKRVDSTGDDLKKNIFPLPVRDPSSVLFQLLSLLIDYTNRIYGATEMLAGQNPGQNTPAANGDHMVEQGLKIYAAIYKRIWRSMKEEFKKLYVLNAAFLPLKSAFPGGIALREDYLGDPNTIVPAADKNIVSDRIAMQQAAFLGERARMVPGYDIEKVEKNILRAAKVDGVDLFYPGPKVTGPLPNPKVQVEEIKQKIAELKIKSDAQQFAIKMMEEHDVNEGLIKQYEANALKLASEAKGVETGHLIAMIDAQIGATKAKNEDILGKIKALNEFVRTAHDIHTDERTVPSVGAKSSDAGPAQKAA